MQVWREAAYVWGEVERKILSKTWLVFIIWRWTSEEKCVYANCGHLNGGRQLGSDSNSNFIHFPHLFIGWLEERRTKLRTSSQVRITKRILHATPHAHTMASQAEMNYSYGLQKLYSFSTGIFSVHCFLWKACFMWVPFVVVAVLSSSNITSMQNICYPRKCIQN